MAESGDEPMAQLPSPRSATLAAHANGQPHRPRTDQRTQVNRFRAKKHAQVEKGDLDLKASYQPCHHPGVPCTADVCSCVQRQSLCAKFCHCYEPGERKKQAWCENMFPGCSCTGGCQRKNCPCYHLHLECDPDLCRSCGAGGGCWF